MGRLTKHILASLLLLASACCTPQPPIIRQSKSTTYICKWQDVNLRQGISVVVVGGVSEPSDISPKELAKKGLSYKVQHERSMECQAVEPPEELRKRMPSPGTIKGTPPKPKRPTTLVMSQR